MSPRCPRTLSTFETQSVRETLGRLGGARPHRKRTAVASRREPVNSGTRNGYSDIESIYSPRLRFSAVQSSLRAFPLPPQPGTLDEVKFHSLLAQFRREPRRSSTSSWHSRGPDDKGRQPPRRRIAAAESLGYTITSEYLVPQILRRNTAERLTETAVRSSWPLSHHAE